jgi:hypothetical protein
MFICSELPRSVQGKDSECTRIARVSLGREDMDPSEVGRYPYVTTSVQKIDK